MGLWQRRTKRGNWSLGWTIAHARNSLKLFRRWRQLNQAGLEPESESQLELALEPETELRAEAESSSLQMQNHWPQSRHVLALAASLPYPTPFTSRGTCDDVISVRDAVRAHCERLCHLALNGHTVLANVSVIWPLHDQCICICICSSNSARACSSLSSVGRCRLCQVDPCGGSSFRANLLRYLFVFFWAHTSCAHRRPIGPRAPPPTPSSSGVVRWQPR